MVSTRPNAVSSTTANGIYDTGDVVDVTVLFSEPVTVTGTPQITLETGSIDRTVSYTSGSGTDTLTFQYVVQPGDTSLDLNYVNVNSLMLNGGSINALKSPNNGAILTLPSLDFVLKVRPVNAFGSLGLTKDLIIVDAPPIFDSGIIQEGTGVLSVTFSETINPDNVTVGSFTISDTAGNHMSVSLVDTTHAIDPDSDDTLTITLTEAQRQQIISYTGSDNNDILHLDIAEDAVSDVAGNGIAASEDNAITTTGDTAGPEFGSATFDANTGVLDITFNETISNTDSSSVDLSKLFLSAPDTENQVPLAGATVGTIGDSVTLSITLTEEQRISTLGNSLTPQLDIAEDAVSDVAGNGIAASEDNAITTTGDTAGPDGDALSPTSTQTETSSSSGSGRINLDVSEESHAEFLHKDIDKSNCDSKGFGMGISLRIFSIGYDRETSTVNVELLSTCGPASVSVNTDAGVHLAALSLTSEQLPQSSANSTEKQHLIYSAIINSDADSFTVIAKDKRDTFTQTITLSDDFVEKKYHHRTGYTSEQLSSLENLNAIEDDPRPIADKTVLKNTDPIPLWIKSDLELWNGSPARDIFFFNSIDYLIDNRYIVYEDWEKSKSLRNLDTYPKWLLNDVGNYLDGNLTDAEFTELIETLIEERVVRIADDDNDDG